MPTPPLSGRRAQAARNDELILQAAHEVFVADPDAPISAVAERAGVGISALYRRYASKEDLLRRLCGDGLARYIEAIQAAVDDPGDVWAAFVTFMECAVDAESSALTVRLAGTFEPSEQLYREAARAGELNDRLFARLSAAGAVRHDLHVNDIALVLEQLATINLGDRERNRQLRRRHLTLALDGMRAPGRAGLPGPPPTDAELSERWGRAR
jgi:AcrR family transcriptional regulator